MLSTYLSKSKPLITLLSQPFGSKQLLFSTEARKKLLQGCKQLCDAVQVTLGPGGRNVLIDQSYGSPKITKDGVTVAKAIELADKDINIGASLVKSVANNANDEAGDGTTTATLLAKSIYEEGFRKVESGLNPMHIKKGIEKAVDFVSNYLKEISTEIKTNESIANVATISANGDRKIGSMLAQLYQKVGIHGTITVKQGKTLNHEIEYADGLKIDRGYVSPYFVTDNKKQKIEYDGSYVLIVQKKITNFRQVLPFIDFTYQKQKPLLLIAEDFESEVLTTLIINKLKNNLKICAVKSPSFGDNRKAIMQDLAVFTGGKHICQEEGITFETIGEKPENIEVFLGYAGQITITKDDTIFLDGKGQKKDLQERCEVIRNHITLTESSYDRTNLEERLAKLSGGIGVIKVGGGSQVEVGQIKDRVTDALCATKAAISEGIVPGGGSALLYASTELNKLYNDPKLTEGEQAGIKIIQNAIKNPTITICKNAGFEGPLVAAKLLEQSNKQKGFNASTGKYVNMRQSGIIDPTKVVRTALVDASSVAGLMLTTECMIFDEIEKKE